MLKVLRGLGFTVKSHMSVASQDMLDAIEDKFKREIEEVKKDDEARKQKIQELEAKKRREEAKNAALKRKAIALAKERKTVAEKKAREQAARELAEKKAREAETTTAEEAAKPVEEKKPEREPAPPRRKEEIKAPAPKKEYEVKPMPKPKPFVRGRVKPEPPTKKPAEPARAAAPQQKARGTKKKEERKSVTVSPESARQLEKKLQHSAVTGTGPKKRKKRDKKKRQQQPRVDKQAVKLSFKQTMATLDGTKKHKKYRKREDGEIAIEDGAPSIEVTEFMTVSELAKLIEKRPAEVVAKCMELGMMASINQRLDIDTLEMLAMEFGYNIRPVEEVGAEVLEMEDEKNLEPRSPVVTIMGHVDHGKTTLLDYLRESNIVAGESGKITQHIGAYSIEINGGNITFLDTPGHEAFSAMRARGAQVTDIVVLIVSAVEAVMPQTVEAINHAQAAGVPIIVAINKMDLEGANPDSVRQQLSKHNLLGENWGGKTIMVELSAKTGQGVDKLLEMILLQAEVMELQADAGIRGQGAVIEAKLEKGRGSVATILVQKGTLHIGDPFIAGSYFGRVRAMVDDRGRDVKAAGPSTPVQVTGLSGVPYAGDPVMGTADETEARIIATKRLQIRREYDIRRAAPTTLESAYAKIKDGQINDLKIVIKGDVAGSVEALSDTLSGMGNEEVRVTVIHTGVGAIAESDVDLAIASQAIIIGFHVTADPRARERAVQEKVDIRTYTVIYEVKDDIKKALEGMLSPEYSEKWMGNAEVRQTFRVPKIGIICGSYVQQGIIRRNDKIRVTRNGVIIHEGTISSLKRFKDDAKEVSVGQECGIGIDNFDDIKVGDILEDFVMIATERKL